MFISKEKTEFTPIKSRNDYFDKLIRDKKSINFGLIFLILFVLILFNIIYFLILINKKTKELLQQKNLEIKKLKEQLNYLNQQKDKQIVKSTDKKNVELKQTEENLTQLEKEYLYDLNFYNKYNMRSNTTLNKLGYESIVYTHTLEKGMEHFELRPFAVKKIEHIISLIKHQSQFENHINSFSFINGINTLREYKKIYDENGWNDKEEYEIVKDFLKDYNNIEHQKTGAYILTKKELEKDFRIDYLKFLKSRHSTRNYKNESIKFEDVQKAMEMAKYSASSCNRQFIKVHFYPSGKMRENVIRYSIGKGGLYLDGVNTFIISFDVNALSGVGERNQGYFNAGLYSTNLVNAFHSLGIGTCFIQFNNSVKEEEELKKLNNIPEYERIAVILFAGYYDEKSIFAVSPRKDIKELLFKHE